MRLIDADAINPMRCPRSISEMRKWIDEQPTAYDIDKVVEQLEECKTKKYVSGITNTPYEFGACHAMDDAIKIVKGGGTK